MTEQLDWPATADSVNSHDEELNVPSEEASKLTVPAGADGVPALSLSVAVTVHVAVCETSTGGPQLTASVVARRLTIRTAGLLDSA